MQVQVNILQRSIKAASKIMLGSQKNILILEAVLWQRNEDSKKLGNSKQLHNILQKIVQVSFDNV